MKRILTLALTAMMVFTTSAHANQNYTIKIKDGRTVSVEACSDQVFRVKVSPRDSFTESLMERYGILKTDWAAVNQTVSETAGQWTLSTPGHKLTVDKTTGAVKITNTDGTAPLGQIDILSANTGDSCERLAKVINDKFGGLNVTSNGGIIGDDDGSISEKDKEESGDPAKSSIISIKLSDAERFYGGGSTSREHIQHRGELLRMHTTYQRTEIPMPFMMSSNGWGIFNNTTRKNYFDVGSFESDKLNIYNTFDEADFYILLGGNMPSVLNLYTEITGRTYVLPRWAYGLCFGPNMREDQWDILSDAVNFREYDVPCDLFWLEPQWMSKRYDFSTEKKFNSQTFSVEPYWLEDKYPKTFYPRLFIGKLRSLGFHLGLWLCEEYDLSIQEEDNIAMREHRDTSGIEHWMDHLTTFLDLGVDGFKMDPARTIDEHTYRKYYNGRTDREMHNLNQILLPKQMVEMGKKHTGKRTWHHYCAGWSGTQHWGASTSGDNGGGKTALFDQINLGMSGFMNTSCDVMSVERELEMQSLHFGLFLPWVQINSWFSMMHPFYYGEHEQAMYRDYVKLRYSLLPYIYSTALEGSMNGMPIARAMPLVFPDDRNVDDMWNQYMFGDNFCVGIFTNEIYLPEGTWTDAWTGETIVSHGETFTRQYPENRAGLLYIKQGSIIPTQHDVKFIGTDPITSFILKVYPHGDSSYTMYEDDGETYAFENGAVAATRFECKQSGKQIELTICPVEGSYEGLPSSRNFEVEMALASKPSKVAINGKATKAWTYSDGKLCIDLGGVNINDSCTLTVR